MSYREELIQVAAVAVAMIQDHDNNTTEFNFGDKDFIQLFRDIGEERARQEAKWGAQHHTPDKWLVILMEEVGEVARANLEGDF